VFVILQRDRAIVSIAKLQPRCLVLQIRKTIKDLGHLVSRPLSDGPESHDLGIEPIEGLTDGNADSSVCGGAKDVTAGDGPAFLEDCGEKERAAPAFDDGAEFPGEIPGVADSAV
jgi:hypothetical protein